MSISFAGWGLTGPLVITSTAGEPNIVGMKPNNHLPHSNQF